jgi:uncharacterized protein (DUF1501 family)
MSRRELIAWLAAATGATATGVSVFGDSWQPSSPATTRRPASAATGNASTGTAMPAGNDAVRAPGADSGADGPTLLVVIELPGGNDGLSTVVPYGLGQYYDLRSQTAIAAGDVLTLDDEIGLHPELTRLHERGVTVVEGIGSFEPDGSHFEMLARWWAGASTRSSMSAVADTGWLGRVADLLDDGSTPATVISIGTGAHPIVRSRAAGTVSLRGISDVDAVVGADSEDVYRSTFQAALRQLGGRAGDALSTDTLSAFRGSIAETLAFAERLGSQPEHDRSMYPASGLGESLQFASTVFAADAGVRVVHVAMDGDFDTHEGHSWKHPNLMADLDESLAAFDDDLRRRGLTDRVLTMTTSEFGRTARENDSGGLDHGTASTGLLIGPTSGVRLGEAPSLSRFDDNDDLIATVAFESYLGGVVEGWLGIPASEVFGSGTQPLDLLLA